MAKGTFASGTFKARTFSSDTWAGTGTVALTFPKIFLTNVAQRNVDGQGGIQRNVGVNMNIQRNIGLTADARAGS